MRVTLTTEAGQVDVRTPGSYHPEVLGDMSREAVRLLANLHVIAGYEVSVEAPNADGAEAEPRA